VEDLTKRLARVLRGREALTFAGAQKQRLAVGREGDPSAEVSALAAHRIAPQDLEPF
jgi:hypothetical protein